MEVHAPKSAPDHVHGCPVHPGGTPAASTGLVDGVPTKMSDACFWSEHDAAFQLTNKTLYDAAVATKG